MFESIKITFEAALSSGSLRTYPLIFVLGFATSLLPCTYPVIPITVSYLGGASAGKPARGFVLSLFYVLGLTITYTALAGVALATRAALGAQASSPWVYLALSVVLVVLGLWMLGALRINLGSGLAGKRPEVRGRPLGALAVGLVAGLILGPCSGPVLLAVLLLVVAKGASTLFALSLVVAFSFGIGLLYVLVGTFSGLVTSLPKPGRWMVALEWLFAGALFAAALYYAFLAGERWRMAPREGAGSGVVAYEMPARRPQLVGDRFPQFRLPSLQLADGGVQRGQVDTEEVLAAGKPVVIVFWATWCAACIEEIPKLNELYGRHGDRVSLLAINYGEAIGRGDLERFNIRYPVLLDTWKDVSDRAFAVPAFPYNVFADSDGVIVKAVGAWPEPSELRELLDLPTPAEGENE